MTGAAIPASGIARFRLRLAVSMMVLVTGIAATGLFIAKRNLNDNVETDQQHRFDSNLAKLHSAQEVRHAVLLDRCRTLVRRPRILAAFEDGALDLLYPSARDELRDIMVEDPNGDPAARGLHGVFYRFIDRSGAIISPPDTQELGWLSPEDEAALKVTAPIDRLQVGYRILKLKDGSAMPTEIMITPIISTETDEVIASIAIGFKPTPLAKTPGDEAVQEITWTPDSAPDEIVTSALAKALAEKTLALKGSGKDVRFAWNEAGREFRVFVKQLNPGSLLPPAYEVVLYPLDEQQARMRRLTLQFIIAGVALVVGGFIASHFIAGSLAQPVEKLAVDSEENRKGRAAALSALSQTSEELERTARFSSDASHQLKTPVTVMRAGLDEILAREDLPDDVRDELQMLVHQTFRLTSIVEDLLLLSRMDAGRLELQKAPLNLVRLVESALDDLSVLSDDLKLQLDIELPDTLWVKAEGRYLAVVLQNLLENARKYNVPHGRIRVHARVEAELVKISVGNSGASIPEEVQQAIFERFHRGNKGEDVPGHGLGLNLSRELMRLHGGELRLVGSVDDWTEFEMSLPALFPHAV